MKKIRPAHGPEWHIQKRVVRFLRDREWHVERTHGNLFMKGFPDLYVAHKKFGQRWIDAKNPASYQYTKAQCQKWPVWHEYGIGIWIIVAATLDEYDKLFQPPNWKAYWKPRYDDYLMDPADLLAEMQHEEAEEEGAWKTENLKAALLPKTAMPDGVSTDVDTGWLNDLE